MFVALFRRGVAYQGKKDWQNAKNDLENVLKEEPKNKQATVSVNLFHKEIIIMNKKTISNHF